MEETKKRNRVTVTSMIEAIDDIYVSTLEDPEELGFSAVDLQRVIGSGEIPKYRARLMLVRGDEYEQVLESWSDSGFEDALSKMLHAATERLEQHKKKVLENLESQLSRHRGTIKGARSRSRAGKE